MLHRSKRKGSRSDPVLTMPCVADVLALSAEMRIREASNKPWGG